MYSQIPQTGDGLYSPPLFFSPAGCDADIQPQDPQQQLDMAKNLFWDYVAKMTRTAEDSVEQIKQSQLGHEFK